eukprot:1157111-Pelagomonas_calceolata.AAC.11
MPFNLLHGEHHFPEEQQVALTQIGRCGSPACLLKPNKLALRHMQARQGGQFAIHQCRKRCSHSAKIKRAVGVPWCPALNRWQQ